MRTNPNYDPEIGHCPGARMRLCLHCLRYAMMQTWRRLDPMKREAVILMAPRGANDACRLFMSIQSSKTL